NIKNGVSVDVGTTGSLPSALVIPLNASGGGHEDGNLHGRVVAFSRGTPVTLDLLREMNGQSGTNIPADLMLQKATNNNLQQVNAWIDRNGGGGTLQAPKLVPGDLTFFLFAERTPAWEDPNAKMGDYYDILLGKINTAISAANATTLSTVF